MEYIIAHTGEFAALAVAIFWTITALAFESASRKVGSLTVNILRLSLALIFLSIYTMIFRGHLLPTDATVHNWLWLGLSGIVGLVLGDYYLFRLLSSDRITVCHADYDAGSPWPLYSVILSWASLSTFCRLPEWQLSYLELPWQSLTGR
ncbi:MAG: DMT family transporter [Marinilabiliales bacterium]|nr:DMT family transporter [Marinilabiliales bacterium]